MTLDGNENQRELPKRKRTRLEYYDYSSPGAYFITFCTHNRKNTLSRIVGAIHESPALQLSKHGFIVEDIINHFPSHLKATIAQYVIMPNHIHLLVVITDSEALRAIRESPLRARSILSKAIGYIKMNASKVIHQLYGGNRIWQRCYHDHVIRSRSDYEKIAKYIFENPERWQSDCFFNKD